MTVTPGSYLKFRRTAAGKSLDDVAAGLAAEPHVDERARRDWLEMVEADVQPITLPAIVALRRIFPFDIGVLFALERIAQGSIETPPPICRICACSWEDPCVDGVLPCAWAGPDLCAACVTAEPASEAARAAA